MVPAQGVFRLLGILTPQAKNTLRRNLLLVFDDGGALDI